VTRTLARLLATALSLNRIAFGLAYLVAPARAGRGWIGRAARDPATQVFVRGHGARDVALGTGGLAALFTGRARGPGAARAWMAAQAVADASDVFATLAARRRLPRKGVRFALVVAGASTAIAAATAAALGPESRTDGT
jgi:hypothetical protein